MVQIEVKYEGGLHCTAVHGPSGATLATDAPVDNHGRGESFSPTDLLATSFATCVLTTMGIVAERHGWDMGGASATVVKSMVADPKRRVGKLTLTVRVPRIGDPRQKDALQRAAATCPVHESLSEAVDRPVVFEWGPAAVPS
jgi:putative redox protein